MKGKKWLRKTTALCAAAVLGAAAVPSAAFGADSYSAAEKEAWRNLWLNSLLLMLNP